MGLLTAGLKSAPEMRKKIHAFTIRLKPNDSEMYSSLVGLNPTLPPVVVPAGVLEPMLATSVPANARKRNMVVPTVSPIDATRWFLAVLFMNRAKGSPCNSGGGCGGAPR
jgi:hypothetical protein